MKSMAALEMQLVPFNIKVQREESISEAISVLDVEINPNPINHIVESN